MRSSLIESIRIQNIQIESIQLQNIRIKSIGIQNIPLKSTGLQNIRLTIFSLFSMARPRVSIETIRSVNFTIRLTADEHRRIEKAAETCGRKPAVVVREKLFRGKFPQPRMARIELNTYLELKKIGVNLNQLTRIANAGRVTMELFKVLMQLMKQQETIIGKLLYHDSHPENR